ncbi:MAG: DUF1631 family protein [Burkholderiales bacterium]|nr:DUF1631 family protein [Burkholderiales bacterium]
MIPNPVHRLPPGLERAIQRLKLAAREATERTIESLGLAALGAHTMSQRDGLLAAQFEFNRKSAIFALAFNEALDERVLRELGAGPAPASAGTDAGAIAYATPISTQWDRLSLVDDKEVEALISAERFGLEITSACEWELREVGSYVASLLGDSPGGRLRNPLRPELVGHAMTRGIEAVSERADTRKILAAELSRSLGALLRGTYAEIVTELRNAGVQPRGLEVRQPLGGGRGHSGYDRLGRHDAEPSTSAGLGADADSRHDGRLDSRHDSRQDSRYAGRRSTLGGGLGGPGTPLGQVDPAVMSLIRRLTLVERDRPGPAGASGFGGSDYGDSGSGAVPQNLIREHRDELRQVSRGALDHMVIDVIGFMFDQILADPKVPPQMARQIARLQLPVLRAALGDPAFFSSRRHPVRRFVNRIASLGTAFEDFGEDGTRAFLAKVRTLVQEVVEGDFEQIEIYEHKLAALEQFSAELADRANPAQVEAAALLAEKEDQQRLRQLYALRLAGELKDVAAPAFLREFLSGIWSQVLLRAAERGGADSELSLRLRAVGSELVLSVQPKATPAHRKAFLAALPRLMQDLTEGMNLIAWPDAQRRAFFGQLLPAHAEALKSTGGTVLDFNLTARKVEGAMGKPPPSREDLKTAPMLPVLTDEVIAPQISADEAQRIGLVRESAVDWTAPVDIDPTAVAGEGEAAAAAMPPLPGLPGATDAADPTEGAALADHVQIGHAYRMNLEGEWHKVRLAHVSAARSFFIFTHGGRHQKTVSLTQRMLLRLCETGRLKAYEGAYLIERATARARRQLAAVAGV